MIQLTRRASTVIALCVLISAATASADCAWVLWERWYSEEAGESWTPLGARHRSGRATE
jgi:hypothetical protein